MRQLGVNALIIHAAMIIKNVLIVTALCTLVDRKTRGLKTIQINGIAVNAPTNTQSIKVIITENVNKAYKICHVSRYADHIIYCYRHSTITPFSSTFEIGCEGLK